MADWTHDISISPDTMNGERGWWSVAIDGDYDGFGRSVEEALCDLAGNLKDALDPYEGKGHG